MASRVAAIAGRFRFLLRPGACLLAAVLCPAASISAQSLHLLYVSSAASHTISGYTVDPSSGARTAIPGSPFNERLDPHDIAIHPSGKFLYVVNVQDNDVSAFQIDPTTGALTELANSPFAAGGGSGPMGIAVDPSGQFLYVLNALSDNAAVVGGGFGSLNSYSIDQTTGELTPTATSSIDLTNPPLAPIALLMNPVSEQLYVVGNNGDGPTPTYEDALTATFEIDPASGNLSQTASPSWYGFVPYSAAITPNGQFLYLGIGQNEGEIALDGMFAYQTQMAGTFPREMAVDSTGSYLYVAFNATTMSGFSIDQGALTPLSASPFPFATNSLPIVADSTAPFLYFENGGAYKIAADGTLTALAPLSAPSAITGIGVFGPSNSNPIQPVSAPVATFNPSSISFGSQVIGTAGTVQQVVLTNTGNEGLSIYSASISGTNAADFTLQSNSCPPVLDANAQCAFTILFKPSIAGNEQASLLISDNVTSGSSAVGLSGVGLTPAPAVTLVPGSLTFPSTDQETLSASQSVTVTNSGTAVLDIVANGVMLSGPNPGDFKLQADACSGHAVAIGSSCTISMAFDPAAQGVRTAYLQISDNAADSPQTVSLSGTGVAPFTINPSAGGAGTSQTVTAGVAAQFDLQLTPAGGFSGVVSISCTGAPPGAVCTVPSTVSLNGPNAQPVVVTVTTTSRAGIPAFQGYRRSPKEFLRPGWAEWYGLLCGICLIILWRMRSATFSRMPRRALGMALAAMLLILSATLSSCGGPGSNSSVSPSIGTPSGTYTMTVTATADGAVQVFDLFLTVQ